MCLCKCPLWVSYKMMVKSSLDTGRGHVTVILSFFSLSYHLGQLVLKINNCEFQKSLNLHFPLLFLPLSLLPSSAFLFPPIHPKPQPSTPCQILCWTQGHRDDKTLPSQSSQDPGGIEEVDQGTTYLSEADKGQHHRQQGRMRWGT